MGNFQGWIHRKRNPDGTFSPGESYLIDFKCKECLKTYKNLPSCDNKYCSRKCFDIAHGRNMRGEKHFFFGKHHTSKTRKKIKSSWKKAIANGYKRSKESIRKGALKLMGENHPLWNGGQLIDKDGYQRILCKNIIHPCGKPKYVLKHRLVIEEVIGKKLLSHWDVHHINENRLDNRIQNLMLFDSRSSHRRYENGGKYSKSEILFDGRAQ